MSDPASLEESFRTPGAGGLSEVERKALRGRALVVLERPAEALATVAEIDATGVGPELAVRVLAVEVLAHGLQGRHEDAIATADRLVDLADATERSDLIGEALILRGLERLTIVDHQGAVEDLGRAWELVHDLGDPRLELEALAALAQLDEVRGNDRAALTAWEDALERAAAQGWRHAEAILAFNYARVLEAEGDFEAAERWYRRSWELCLGLRDSTGVAYALYGLGAVIAGQGDVDGAVESLRAARSAFETVSEPPMILATWLEESRALQQGERWEEALGASEEALRMAVAQERLLDRAAAHCDRGRVLAGLARFEEAYADAMECMRIRTEADDASRRVQSEALRVRFDTRTKERRNEALERENRRQVEQIDRERARWRRWAGLSGISAALAALLLWGIWRDRKHKAHLAVLASTDDLTGLANRRATMARLVDENERAEREGTPLSILLLDLDSFKEINDRWGHGVGDRVLRRVAKVLASGARSRDSVGRWGGEEFLVLLPGTDGVGAGQVARRMQEGLEHLEISAGEEIPVTFSGGVATRERGETVDRMLRRADLALYRAKAAGRNRVLESTGERTGRQDESRTSS